MVRSFRGEGDQKVDAKGRVSIPASYRTVLRDCDPNWSEGKLPEFVIVYGGPNRDYLECFTIDAANEMDERISRLPRGSANRRLMERLFHTQSHLASVDDTGRIVLPAKLRNKIGIENMAYFAAKGDTFQIWKPETYKGEDSDLDELLASLPAGADEWSLLEMGEGA
ncbi:MAG: division/cell wall cluster transcriptional repressor MraZ [Silicimonas sp.]|nr:division/cell wall cluster transcriptional repressor MraZ [Silicimonas sp.]